MSIKMKTPAFTSTLSPSQPHFSAATAKTIDYPIPHPSNPRARSGPADTALSAAISAAVAFIDSDAATTGDNGTPFTLPQGWAAGWTRLRKELAVNGRLGGVAMGQDAFKVCFQRSLNRVAGSCTAAEKQAVTLVMCSPDVIAALLRSSSRHSPDNSPHARAYHLQPMRQRIAVFWAILGLIFEYRPHAVRTIESWLDLWCYPVVEILVQTSTAPSPRKIVKLPSRWPALPRPTSPLHAITPTRTSTFSQPLRRR
ncbi:hypothetical protein B0H17DRAFT_1099645 [Mycena rosella]|uniref:Uncharacterized protein n=1 Tax=Mycena rosella TaxID=1033263 RepID=A0AAD7CN74_MYCRO|nr:hypothetical protein B0H17DRAFT_1099645 [Mycena rosella]